MAVPRLEYNKDVINDDLFGNKVYLLGKSDFGEVNSPTLVRSIAQAEDIFGTEGNLLEGYKQIKSANSEAEVYLVKATGKHSILKLNLNIPGKDVAEKAITFKSVYANEIYNGIKVSITNEIISFEFPQEIGGSFKSYNISDYNVIENLAKAINDDTVAGKNHVYMNYNVDPFSELANNLVVCNNRENYLYGGNSGVGDNKNILYQALGITYDILTGEDIDVIVPLDAFIDDIDIERSIYGISVYGNAFYSNTKDRLTLSVNNSKVSFYNQLLLFCVKQMRFGNITFGVMGFDKTQDKFLLNKADVYLDDYVRVFLKRNALDEDLKSYHFLISVVIGDVSYNYKRKISNGYVFYAGLITRLKKTENSTNKIVSDTLQLYTEFSNEQLEKASSIGVVAFRMSPLLDEVVVYNGVTTVNPESDYSLLCNARMVQMTMKYIKDQFELYIGEDITEVYDSGAAEENLNSLLEYLTGLNVIDKFSTYITKEQDGNLLYYVILKTIYTVENIGVVGGSRYNSGLEG